jgi:hypothetical protein
MGALPNAPIISLPLHPLFFHFHISLHTPLSMIAPPCSSTLVYLSSVIFNGTNFWEWLTVLGVCSNIEDEI